MSGHLGNKKGFYMLFRAFVILFLQCIYLNVAFAGEDSINPWGYEGGTGPYHWGELEKDHEKHLMCREGRNQSPINISDVRGSKLASLKFHYFDTPIKIINNTHTMHLNYNRGSYVTWGNQRFKLIQFHFHHPSEHLIAGKPYAMEMHMVHKTPQHEYVVIGVFLKEGKHNPHLEKIWDRFPSEIDKETIYHEGTVSLIDILPENREYFHYFGSLTTPPCSENVNWFVLDTPIEISRDQISYFQKFIDHNARPTQKLNHRVVVKAK